MSTRFAEVLDNEKIDPRRLLVASRGIERLRPEDRAARLAHRQAKRGDAGASDQADKPKRRSGRVITLQLLRKAQLGQRLSGPQKTRLLRALNRVLEQKKRDPLEMRAVF